MSVDNHDEDVCYVDNGRQVMDFDNDLEGIGSSSTEIINIDTGYQPTWGPIEGFRENYQNWKDGIMRSFDIQEEDFQIVAEDSDHQKLFLVYLPDKADSHKKLVGFIKFTYDAENYGVCELTNFKASLQRRHLGIGGTSKANDAKQVGQHGEGLKLSALVNRRHPHNYGFVVISSGFRWIFGWNIDKKLNCRIQRIPRAELVQQKALAAEDDEKGVARAARGRAWEDVSIIIGEPRRCRSFIGEMQLSSKIPLVEFDHWISTTLDICPPSQMIKTEHGDLILDPDHAGKIYLHGLQLPSGSKSGLPFVYAYNLLDVRTGRDRDTVTDAQAEAKKIASIWSSAIKRESGQIVLRNQYIDLLQTRMHTAADVCGVGKIMPEADAVLIWETLKARAKRESQFYYCASSNPQDYDIISRCLGLTPLSLKLSLWKLLRRHNLCFTAEEESSIRFRAAKTVDIANDPFPQHVMHALRALMAQEPSLRKLELILVDSGNLNIVANYHDGRLRIGQKWFTYEGAHDFGYCEHQAEGATELKKIFSCDHAVLWLWDHILKLLKDEKSVNLDPSRQTFLTSAARAKLQLMLRRITFYTNEAKNELYIRWISMEPPKNANKFVLVTLHSPMCEIANKNSNVLIRWSAGQGCLCQTIRTRVGDGGVIFKGVSSYWTYVPKVVRDSDGAIYSVTTGVTLSTLPVIPQDSVSQEIQTLPDFRGIAKLFVDLESNEWTAVSYDRLFRDGFPYTHTWIEAKKSGSHILIAKSKSSTIKNDLKRILDNNSTSEPRKKPKKGLKSEHNEEE